MRCYVTTTSAAGRRLQVLVQELSLVEAHPPLVWGILVLCEDSLRQTKTAFLAQLSEVQSHCVCFTSVRGIGHQTTQCKVSVSWEGKIFNCQLVESLFGAAFVLADKLQQGLRDVQRQVDQDAIRGAFDFKITEQHIGFEITDCFVDDIFLVCSTLRRRSLEFRFRVDQSRCICSFFLSSPYVHFGNLTRMPGPYHSNWNTEQLQVICNMSVLPLKTKFKGPAPQCAPDKEDIVDEAISFFKANVLFRNFEVKGPADRVLVYLTLYVSQCLLKLVGQNKSSADKALYQLAIENFALPGDRNFALGGLVTNPANRQETDTMRLYLTQLRQECGIRLTERVYAQNQGAPDKWWMCFNKRKFLNKNL